MSQAIISENMPQDNIDTKNKEFWNEMCGSGFAQSIGIKDTSQKSLRLFDKAYMDLYPYLYRYLDLNSLKSSKVLEIGLGYGTVSNLLAKSSLDYSGLDIAANPVAMVNDRIERDGLNGKATQGSMLECPFSDESFDNVYSIGCFHHTGDMQRCVDETFRVLKPGGKAVIMVYNSFSYKRWIKWPITTLKRLIQDLTSSKVQHYNSSLAERHSYDPSYIKDSSSAPQTEFFSKRDIGIIFNKFSKVKVEREGLSIRGKVLYDDNKILNGIFSKTMGLNLYITAEK